MCSQVTDDVLAIGVTLGLASLATVIFCWDEGGSPHNTPTAQEGAAKVACVYAVHGIPVRMHVVHVVHVVHGTAACMYIYRACDQGL